VTRHLTRSVFGLLCAGAAHQNNVTQNNVTQNKPTPTIPDQGPTVGVARMLPDGTIGIQLSLVSKSGAIGDTYREYKPNDANYEEVKRHLGDIKPGETKSFTLPPE